MLCSRVQNLLSAYCDRELSGAEMLQIRRHLDQCAACRKDYEEIQVVKRLLSALPSVEPEEEFSTALIDSHPRLQPTWERLRAAYAGRFRLLVQGPLLRLSLPARSLPFAAGGALVLSTLTVVMLSQPQPPDAIRARVPERVLVEDRSLLPLLQQEQWQPVQVIHPAGIQGAVLPEPGASEPIFIEEASYEVAYPVYLGGRPQPVLLPTFSHPYGRFHSNTIVPASVVESVGDRR